MYPHSLLWHYLWIAPLIFQVVIVFILIKSNRFREFPAFTLYTLFELVLGSTLFVMDHSPGVSPYQYWYVHSVGQIVSIALRFSVIHEIFSMAFRIYPGVWQLSRLMFRWTAVVLILLCVAVSAYSPGEDTYRLFAGIHLLNRAVSLLQTGLLIFLFSFSSYFGLGWRNFAYGVALGLGVFSSVNLAVEALRIWLGPSASNFVFDFITMGTYQVSVAIWLLYSAAEEPARQELDMLPKVNLEHWNAELQRFLLK